MQAEPVAASDSDVASSGRSHQASKSQEKPEEPGSPGVDDEVSPVGIDDQGNVFSDVCKDANRGNITLQDKSPVNEPKNSPNSTPSHLHSQIRHTNQSTNQSTNQQKVNKPKIHQHPVSGVNTASPSATTQTINTDENPELLSGENSNGGDNAHEEEIKDDLVENLSKIADFKETSKNIKSPLEEDLNIHTDTGDRHPANESLCDTSVTEPPILTIYKVHGDIPAQSESLSLSQQHDRPSEGHTPPNTESLIHESNNAQIRANSDSQQLEKLVQDAGPASQQSLEEGKKPASDGLILFQFLSVIKQCCLSCVYLDLS